MTSDVVALDDRGGPPVGDEVVVDVEELGGMLVYGEHRLCEGDLDREEVGRLCEGLETRANRAKVREGLRADERAGVFPDEVLGPLERGGPERERYRGGEAETTPLSVDDTWRAICFTSGEPRGLSVSLSEVLAQLKAIVGNQRPIVGFDRGGSYPRVFSALAGAGMDWVTWRRAPLSPRPQRPGVPRSRSAAPPGPSCSQTSSPP